MMIVTAKLSKSKLLAAGLLILAAIVCIVLLSRDSGSAAAAADAHDTAAKTNEQRVAFLASYGWQVEPDPVQTQEVRIPKEFPDILTRYNEVQTAQGFDLTRYAGKTAKRYVYRVTNYPDAPGEVLATLIVCKNKIIGGDLCSSAQDGFLHGFQLPAQDVTATVE